ncbi:L-serine ammonia-lyase [Aestuariivirga litoralis]|uniref:L-serine ammonia-lyase n=1 Tax=Aestuariivirga litoralis TaxID=2650924 RepID=UPI0018C76DCD|nr:L-serine ammonia-lyase [Aestuariivirga litoralis]MBG1232900.1 L-serine ammonia-lyase [Aestuariivirga litoralis]
MFLSVFEIFKIGIGPSSSHTMGPMVAARRFVQGLSADEQAHATRLTTTLYGSLAFTGKGHSSDKAVVLGLAGQTPDTLNPDDVEKIIAGATSINLGTRSIPFDAAKDVIFDFGPALKAHANGMIMRLWDGQGEIVTQETYFSIGGGFVQTEKERLESLKDKPATMAVRYPFANAAAMLEMGEASGLSIAAMKRVNETTNGSDAALDATLDKVWGVMQACINRGLKLQGQLPGGLKVKRRAADVFEKLKAEQGSNAVQPHQVMDYLSVYAMAVNEENAAGGKIVTAPTNGAAGVVPAVIRYYLDHCAGADRQGIHTFLLTAAAIGGIIKHNASISGAEVGCQGEVGSASAMAAAGLCAALGGTNAQIENAAEIALEHHLGMTCDPVGGLVQVPCIERNAFGAVKAVAAASLALRGDGTHIVPLDSCVETMRQTGVDMSDRYKETSQGGLAVNVVEC